MKIVQVGDEILVKIKVERITDKGNFCNYNYPHGGFTTSRSTISPGDVIEVIKAPTKVGDKFISYNGLIHKIEYIGKGDKDTREYALISVNGYVQYRIISIKELETHYKRVEQ